VGTLYQGRYRSAPVATDEHLLTAVRYVERNPVRARLVASAALWPWSSVHERLGGRGGLLVPLPAPVPEDWLAYVDRPETPAEASAWRGRPGGGAG
jgi:putative transposase